MRRIIRTTRGVVGPGGKDIGRFSSEGCSHVHHATADSLRVSNVIDSGAIGICGGNANGRYTSVLADRMIEHPVPSLYIS
ncbi:hypothetical protein [Leptolyngbya ohadii]|uniref:hypothetical protein n=1 Tax=Leptolyngbya ohadii TaxID=1962290 RepID=UPI0015C626BF|nr:hypothetical protein [Leptolyngbya ohadii]